MLACSHHIYTALQIYFKPQKPTKHYDYWIKKNSQKVFGTAKAHQELLLAQFFLNFFFFLHT
jgi:hypothetical protein